MNRETDTVFLQTIGKFISAQVQLATTPLLQKIDQLEKEISQLKDMQDVTFDDREKIAKELDGAIEGFAAEIARVEKLIPDDGAIAAGIKTEIEKFSVVDGKDGEPGKDGKDADMEALLAYVENYMKAIPLPQNGKDGLNGKDGIDGKDGKDGPAGLNGADVVAAFRDSDRHLILTLSNGVTKDIGSFDGRDGKDGAPGEPGKDGKDGERGKDGLGIKDLSISFDGRRTFTFKHVCEDGSFEEKSFVIPAMIYADTWREGHYERGDVVTKGGSGFVALEDTDSVPETLGCKWKLFVKRGAPGKQGDRGEPGDSGKHGRDGRDLTQMGFDGKKW